MTLIENYQEAGRGRATFSPMTVVGAAVGNKASWKAIERSVFNSGQRTFSRKRTIWACAACLPTVKAQLKEPLTIGKILTFVVGAVVLGIALIGMFAP